MGTQLNSKVFTSSIQFKLSAFSAYGARVSTPEFDSQNFILRLMLMASASCKKLFRIASDCRFIMILFDLKRESGPNLERSTDAFDVRYIIWWYRSNHHPCKSERIRKLFVSSRHLVTDRPPLQPICRPTHMFLLKVILLYGFEPTIVRLSVWISVDSSCKSKDNFLTISVGLNRTLPCSDENLQ